MRNLLLLPTLSLALGLACASGAKKADVPERKGPQTLLFDPDGNGDPASLLWDNGTLYIADNKNDQIWTWTDAHGFVKLVKVPGDPDATASGKTELGQIVRLSDGTLVVPRFGAGKHGAI